MHSHWKNIAVFLDLTADSTALGRHAVELAQRHRAHLIGVYGINHADSEHHLVGFARGSGIGEAMVHATALDSRKAAAAREHFATICEDYDGSSESRIVWSSHAHGDAVLHSLHCDLVMLGYPSFAGLPHGWTPDRLSEASAAPMLVIPTQWTGPSVGCRIVIAWNATREAKRAVTDALPLLSAAESVTVLVVDPHKPDQAYGEDPGSDIALYLARHGARVTVAQVDSRERTIAETIVDYVTAHDSDLVVFGASRHSRIFNTLFGGTSQSLARGGAIPFFMSC